MPVEKSAGAVVFYREPDGEIKYLLLQHRAGHWAFPKGLIEKGEALVDAARREVKEESGFQNFELTDSFKETERYFFKVKYDYQLSRGWRKGQNVLKFVTYFLARAESRDVKLSQEHTDFTWLNFEDALKMITYGGAKKILKKADEFLNRISKKGV